MTLIASKITPESITLERIAKRQKMSTAYFTSNEDPSCSPGDCCARERERLLLDQKRLKLQKERVCLDQEILEAEKINFKKSVKLAAKQKNRALIADKSCTERTNKQFREQQDKIESLRAQLRATQKKEEYQERRANSADGIASVDSSSEEQNLRIQKLEKELREVNHDHKSLKQIHKLEREKWENELCELMKNYSRSDTPDCSLKDEVQRIGILLENSEKENKSLRKESLRSKRSFESLLKMASKDGRENDFSGTDIFVKLTEKFKVLQEERDMLEIQLTDQSRRIDDWKLLLPRNKVVLDQTISKNRQLMKELEEARNRNQQVKYDSKIESKVQMKAQGLMGQEYDESQDILMDGMDTVCLEHSPSIRKNSSATTVPPSNIANTILIPSDLSSEDMNKHDKRFVIEWEWVNVENRLGGLYTGWLDMEGNPSGHGTFRIEDGGIYTGKWKEGLRNGNGVYASIDGAIYSGPWLNDRFHGRGVFVSETNQVYTGDWKNGLRHGSGIETWANGACYTGYYHLDKRNGALS